MSIQKKSLISTIKTAKKANVAADHKGDKQVSAYRVFSAKGLKGFSNVSAKTVKSTKATSTRLLS